MRNVMTVKQLSVCAERLEEAAGVEHRLLVENRKKLEAINAQNRELLEVDKSKAAMLEDLICESMDDEAALRALAEIIYSTDVVIGLRTTVSY